MMQWFNVAAVDINGEKIKLYRPLFVAKKTMAARERGLALDHYAHRYIKAQEESYKILDTNIVDYLENRGDTSKFDVKIPVL